MTTPWDTIEYLYEEADRAAERKAQCATCLGHGEVDCDECGATGYDESGPNETCETCSGTGGVECDDCDGTGKADGDG